MNEEKVCELVSLRREYDLLERIYERIKITENSLLELEDLCDSKCDLYIKVGDSSGLGRDYEIKINGKDVYFELKSIIDKKRNNVLEEKEVVLKDLEKSLVRLNEKTLELKEKI